jgi:hypothetical protein
MYLCRTLRSGLYEYKYKYWSQLELLFLSTLLLQVRNPSEAPPSMEILLSK